ncbi:MAG: ParA family protein [Acidobacteriota bacterium]
MSQVEASHVDRIIERHDHISEEGLEAPHGLGLTSYAMTVLRHRVGKSTLAFNLAYHLSRARSVLLADLSPQCDLTDTIMGEMTDRVTLFDALEPATLGPASGLIPEDISYRISSYCDAFKAGRLSYLIPGDAVLFSYAADLYSRLAQVRDDTRSVEQILHSLKTIFRRESIEKRCELTLMDLDATYAGATHLGWCAADALILPLRVENASLEALEHTLDLLTHPDGVFLRWNQLVGETGATKVAAIVINAVGTGRRATIDDRTKRFLESVLKVIEPFAAHFVHEDLSDAIVLIEDFLSAGRISAARATPIAKLKVGSFHTVAGKRLQVNSSTERYRRQLHYLASLL